MLTLKSPFSEFIDLCRTAGACADGAALATMTDMNTDKDKQTEKNLSFQEGLELYVGDEALPDEWSEWVLIHVGKELDEVVRGYFINKISNARFAMRVYVDCGDFLTDKEDELLIAKYKGKLPTAEKELSTNIVTRAAKMVTP